jgi:environmental stress-induced protein Ves
MMVPQRISRVPSIPWKNGGGTTRTLAVFPEGAGIDDFLWRISLAEISRPGPFSSFLGVDRTIMLCQGDGVRLRSAAWGEHELAEAYAPFAFRGEEHVSCALLGSTTTDLNLMVRRGPVQGTLRTYRAAVEITGVLEEVVILCAEGRVLARVGNEVVSICAGEFLRVLKSNLAVQVDAPESVFVCAVITFHALQETGQRTPC